MQNDKLVDFDHVLLSLSLKLVEHKKLEDISDILTNFQTCLVSVTHSNEKYNIF